MDSNRSKSPNRSASRRPSGNAVDQSSDEAKNLKARLRRLKIQENLLAATATSALLDHHLNALIKDINSKGTKDCDEINNSLEGVKNLFNDFRLNITSPDILRKMEIDEYKKQVSELDDKIVSLKRYLDTELGALRKAEIMLASEIKDIQEEAAIASKKKKIKYNNTRTNPIKKIHNINVGPVQKLENFLKTTGKLGGWGEREHLLFLSCRSRSAKSPAQCGDGAWLNKMLKLLADYLPGVTIEDILAHELWFCQFTKLKAEQKEVLDRWRSNKTILKMKIRNLDLGIENGLGIEESLSKQERPNSVPKTHKLKNVKKNKNSKEINSKLTDNVHPKKKIQHKKGTRRTPSPQDKKSEKFCALMPAAFPNWDIEITMPPDYSDVELPIKDILEKDCTREENLIKDDSNQATSMHWSLKRSESHITNVARQTLKIPMASTSKLMD